LNADKWGGGLFGLKQHNFVTHRHFSIKLGGKKYILLFNNSIKNLCKNLHALLKYQQNSLGLLFVFTL